MQCMKKRRNEFYDNYYHYKNLTYSAVISLLSSLLLQRKLNCNSKSGCKFENRISTTEYDSMKISLRIKAIPNVFVFFIRLFPVDDGDRYFRECKTQNCREFPS